MMKNVNCPEHGNQVLELARGELDDRPALRAQQHLETCSHCSAWWDDQFSSPSFATVDRAVAQSFATVELPRRRRRVMWAAAAGIVVMLSGLAWVNFPNAPLSDDPPVEASIEVFDFEAASPASEIQGISFEDPTSSLTALGEGADANTPEGDDVLFKSNAESGDFGAWTVHT
jgi:hypothetical protein